MVIFTSHSVADGIGRAHIARARSGPKRGARRHGASRRKDRVRHEHIMSNTKYTLKEVTDKALEREFIDLPKRLYKGNRNWVCPLDNDILANSSPTAR